MPRRRSNQSQISTQRISIAIQNRFNPIRNFTPAKLTRALDSFHNGFLKEGALLWDAMERRDVYLGNVASKRKKAAARLPWEIRQMDDSREAKNQAEVLTTFYNSLRATTALEQNERGGLNLLIRQMMDAVGKKFAAHEIVWTPDPDGLKAEFRFCPLWWFENRTGKLRFLQHEGAIDGVDMPDGEWLVTVGEGIMEGCSVIWTFKNMPLKDWVRYSEKFGMPGVLGKSGASPGSEQWNAMVTAAKSLMNDWVAVVGGGDTIELLEVKNGGANLPFPPLVDYCDRALAARWRGADLSTISKGDQAVGASLQGDETDLLLEDDAQLISETLNEQVDRYVLEYTFGAGVEIKAYFKLLGEAEDAEQTAFNREVIRAFLADGTTTDVMANLTDMKALTDKAGLPVNEEYEEPYLPVVGRSGPPVTGETVKDAEGDIVGGMAEPSPNDKTVSGEPGEPGQRVAAANEARSGQTHDDGQDEELIKNSLAEALGVRPKWLAPIKPFLNRLIAALKNDSMDDAAVLNFIEKSARTMPELGDFDINALASVLEGAMGTEVVHGLKDAIRSRSKGGEV
jgi:phage gp29-like protein